MSIFSDRLWNIWSFNSCEYLPFHKLESIWSFPQSHSTLRSNIKTSKVVYVIQTLFSYISTHASHTLHSPSIFSASCILFHPYIKCTPWFHWLQDSCYIKVFISFSLLEEQFQLFSVLWIAHSTNPFFCSCWIFSLPQSDLPIIPFAQVSEWKFPTPWACVT